VLNRPSATSPIGVNPSLNVTGSFMTSDLSLVEIVGLLVEPLIFDVDEIGLGPEETQIGIASDSFDWSINQHPGIDGK
jgi:hypothetical protein